MKITSKNVKQLNLMTTSNYALNAYQTVYSFRQELAAIFKEFVNNQVALDKVFNKIMLNNVEDLYEK